MRNWDVVWIRRVGECLLIFISIWEIVCPGVYAASRALGMHDYRYYDFLDYTAWDFAPYEKPKPRKAFKGYLANGFSEKQEACLYFFPKTPIPTFDKTKLIPLDKAQERIQRINQQTLSYYKKPQEPSPPANPPTKTTLPAQKRMVNKAGGGPVAVVGTSDEKGSAPLSLKNTDATVPLSPEDVLLFLKKKLPPGNRENTIGEILVPFHVPGGSLPTPTFYPSQAIYTQE